MAEVLRDWRYSLSVWRLMPAGRVTGRAGLPEASTPQSTPEFAAKTVFGAVGGNKGGGVLCQALHWRSFFGYLIDN